MQQHNLMRSVYLNNVRALIPLHFSNIPCLNVVLKLAMCHESVGSAAVVQNAKVAKRVAAGMIQGAHACPCVFV